MRASSLGLALVVAVTAACGGKAADARSQWVVHVTTDAPVPQLGDRVLVELLRGDGAPACAACRRLFGLEGPSAWPLSFGVPDAGVADLRLRVRLFRADHSDAGGGPGAGLTLDAVATFPPSDGGVKHVHLTLSTTCAGVAADVARGLTCDATTGELVAHVLEDGAGDDSPRPGSFPLAQSIPCPRPAKEGMVCVEGGLFVRGSTAIALDDNQVTRAAPERLVHLSPFAIDRNEMTVREMRALVAKGAVTRPVMRTASTPACTYTEAPGELEEHPVNCVARDIAVRACEALGKRLPTEAEWEYAAGNRDRETRYPWGSDPDGCSHAIVGRGRGDLGEGDPDPSIACRPRPDQEPNPWGPRPESESEDVTALGIRHLGGNVAEWVSDLPDAWDGPCSEGPRILSDPKCEKGSFKGFMFRGGTWMEPPYWAQVAYRSAITDDRGNIGIGFRCVEPM